MWFPLNCGSWLVFSFLYLVFGFLFSVHPFNFYFLCSLIGKIFFILSSSFNHLETTSVAYSLNSYPKLFNMHLEAYFQSFPSINSFNSEISDACLHSLEGEILKSITWLIISWNLHFSGSGQTIKWPVGSDRPTKRPVKKKAVRWSKEVMGAESQPGHMGQSGGALASTFCDFTTTGGPDQRREALWLGLTRGHSGCWAESLIKGKQNQKREAIAKIRWNITVAWNGGVAKVVTGGQKILDVLWR